MADMGVGETMLLGAAVGGGVSAVTGGNPLVGALGGAAAGGIGSSLFGAESAAAGAMGPTYAELGYTPAVTSGIAGGAAQYAPDFMGEYAAQTGAGAANGASQYAPEMMGEYGGPQVGSDAATASNVYQGGNTAASQAATQSAANQVLKNPQDSAAFMQDPLGWMKANPVKTALAGAGIYTLANALKGGALTKPNYLPTYTPPSAASYGLGRTMASNYAPQMNAIYNRGYASGGITVAPGSVASAGVAPSDLTQSSGIESLMRQYNVTPQQVQQGLNTLGIKSMAAGGLGSYSDGGQMLKGPGDGMSDDIPATISNKQPARLADGEFVVPADVVSHLGNGSTDAGAKQLYNMMAKVRKARTGRKSQGKQIKSEKYLPA